MQRILNENQNVIFDKRKRSNPLVNRKKKKFLSIRERTEKPLYGDFDKPPPYYDPFEQHVHIWKNGTIKSVESQFKKFFSRECSYTGIHCSICHSVKKFKYNDENQNGTSMKIDSASEMFESIKLLKLEDNEDKDSNNTPNSKNQNYPVFSINSLEEKWNNFSRCVKFMHSLKHILKEECRYYQTFSDDELVTHSDVEDTCYKRDSKEKIIEHSKLYNNYNQIKQKKKSVVERLDEYCKSRDSKKDKYEILKFLIRPEVISDNYLVVVEDKKENIENIEKNFNKLKL